MNNFKILLRFCTFALVALFFTMASRTLSAQSPDSAEISKLLAQAKSHAVLAEDDAATLDSYTGSKLSWQSHREALNEMRGHVNALGKVSKQLIDERAKGSKWQQKAIDQIDPLLREMAARLSATIKHLGENSPRIHMPAYREYVHANYEVANKTAGMIRDIVEYDEAQSRAESLEAKLELKETEQGE